MNLSRQRDKILTLYRKLIRLRRSNEALISGGLKGVVANGNILRYERSDDGQHFAILLNLGNDQEEINLERGRIVVSTYLDREDDLFERNVSLRSSEGLIVNLI
jgi:alpha-glucosidase